jgi:hypothetical protein
MLRLDGDHHRPQPAARLPPGWRNGSRSHWSLPSRNKNLLVLRQTNIRKFVSDAEAVKFAPARTVRILVGSEYTRFEYWFCYVVCRD